MKFMKKSGKLLVLFSLLAAVLLGACGEEEEKPVKEAGTATPAAVQAADVDLSVLKDEMLEADKELPEMSFAKGSDENASDLFSYLADFDYDKVEDYFFAYASSGSAEEIAVIELKKSKDASGLETALEKHVKTRVAQYKTYDPTQVELAGSAKIVSEGRYVALITCKGQDEVKKTFTDLVK